MLSNISFTVTAGQTLAVVGSTGAGKSTLVNLGPRLYDATSGAVLVNGVDVRDVGMEQLWNHIGLVPQRPYLFTGTVASNLRYGNADATDEELWDALEIAQGRDFVAAMPGGLDAQIAQGGTNVSGGQRQRLAIARALVKRPDVYFFDDSFSALDLATDARLRAALAPVVADAAVVIVAQRISTIIGADQILVIDAGTQVGLGSHDELLETCPTYVEIVASQVAHERASMSDEIRRPRGGERAGARLAQDAAWRGARRRGVAVGGWSASRSRSRKTSRARCSGSGCACGSKD